MRMFVVLWGMLKISLILSNFLMLGLENGNA